MIKEKIRKIQALRARTAALESELEEVRSAELKTLPAKFGFDSASKFIDAVIEATGIRRRRGRPSRSVPGRRTRATITDEIRAQVRMLVQADRSGAEIAKKVGISVHSVQNIKKALGLVKRRTQDEFPPHRSRLAFRKGDKRQGQALHSSEHDASPRDAGPLPDRTPAI